MDSIKTLFLQVVDKFGSVGDKTRPVARRVAAVVGSALTVGAVTSAQAAESLFEEVSDRTVHPDAAIVSTVVAVLFVIYAAAAYFMDRSKRR
jgi:hypothetical protein